MITKKDFKKWQKRHSNFITPNLKSVCKRESYFIELSSGKGPSNKKMYGVSVYEYTPENEHSEFTAPNHDLNKPFHEETEARRYFNLLKTKFKNYDEIKDIVEEVNQ